MMTDIARKLVLAGAFAAGLMAAGSAVAADLAYKAPVKVIAPAPVPTWTGFYIGGNVGYGWDASKSSGLGLSTTDPGLQPFVDALLAAGSYPASLSPNAKGVIGGGQIGYNWQVSPQWLFGLEADIQGSGIKGSDSRTLFPVQFDATSTSLTKSIDWFGTVRGRIGLLANPQWLIYATGGLAYGDAKLSFNTTDVTSGCIVGATICASGSSSGVRVGWTAGGGVEAMLAPNWSAKVEYLYVDLGRRSLDVPASTGPFVFSASADFREHIVRAGINYHFNWGGPVVARY
ncbi:porin family protein [Bradyrhizobium prioriisuperbiae]|uniref:outer membrane protein n=1 Tax=Bradyrhizobium prioriisuperbiae TaxID=2854389 RepID=UPI0028E277DB|nr:porin family protein [Bradyrhizobium prioritasuperba]